MKIFKNVVNWRKFALILEEDLCIKIENGGIKLIQASGSRQVSKVERTKTSIV